MSLAVTQKPRKQRYLECDSCHRAATKRINGHPKCPDHADLERAHKEGWTVEDIKVDSQLS